MKRVRKLVLCGCFALLALAGLTVQGQEKKSPSKGIDADTIAAYEKLGGKYGVFVLKELPDKSLAVNGLPVFQFKDNPEAKLPDVNVPFGLILSSGPKITDAVLKELAGLENLVWLELKNTTRVSDAGLKELASLKNLTSLDLSGGRIGNVKELAPLVNLEHLNLRFNRVNGAGMKELAALKKLSRLDLDYNEVTDEGAKELACLTSLTVLELDYGRGGLTDGGLKELTALKNLTRLGLSETKITGMGLKHLASFKKLKSLSLDRIQLGRKDRFDKTIYSAQATREIEALETLTDLTFLTLRYNGLSSDFSIRNLKAALPKCDIIR